MALSDTRYGPYCLSASSHFTVQGPLAWGEWVCAGLRVMCVFVCLLSFLMATGSGASVWLSHALAACSRMTTYLAQEQGGPQGILHAEACFPGGGNVLLTAGLMFCVAFHHTPWEHPQHALCRSTLGPTRPGLNLARLGLVLVLKYWFTVFAECDTGVIHFKYTWMWVTWEMNSDGFLAKGPLMWPKLLHSTEGGPLCVFLFIILGSSHGSRRDVLVGRGLIWN